MALDVLYVGSHRSRPPSQLEARIRSPGSPAASIRKSWTLAFGKVEVPCKASTGELRRQYKNIVSRPRIYNHRGNHIWTSPRNDRHRSPVAIEGDDSSMTYISIYMIQPREAQIPNTQRQMESATPNPLPFPQPKRPKIKATKAKSIELQASNLNQCRVHGFLSSPSSFGVLWRNEMNCSSAQ